MKQEYKKWLSQFRKGYIELYTLLVLRDGKSLHGSALLSLFGSNDLIINEGTLYPLLNRMEQNEWLDSSWNIPVGKGHPKREYTISEKGKEILPLLEEAYTLHTNSIEKIKDL